MTLDTQAQKVQTQNVQTQKVRDAHDRIVERYTAMVPAFFSQLQPDQTFLRGLARRVHTSRTNICSSPDVPVAPIRRVLDAGCGPGYFAPLLDEMGFEPTGCDLSPKMIAQARRDYPEVTFDVADIRDLPYGDGAFDCVISWYSLIYFCREERVAALKECRRVLADGGYFACALKADTDAQHVGGGGYGDDVRFNFYTVTVETLKRDLCDAGLFPVYWSGRGPRPGERTRQVFALCSATPETTSPRQ